MDKRTSLLLKVNYRLRRNEYELRRLARAILDDGLTDKRANAMETMLDRLDEADAKTWEALVEMADSPEVSDHE